MAFMLNNIDTSYKPKSERSRKAVLFRTLKAFEFFEGLIELLLHLTVL
jgi:hypothetical protein